MQRVKRLLLLLLIATMATGVSVMAQPQISGSQSGTLGPGTYLVVGDILVPAGETLTIAPGTEFQHNGNWAWYIAGQLHAAGVEGDSIKFVRQQPIESHRWKGIRFRSGASASSIIDYCVIDNCYVNSGIVPPWLYGGGIYIDSVPITIRNTRISHCDTYWHGGGIYAAYAGIVVDHCTIVGNVGIEGADGGGIYLMDCQDVAISNCVIAYNVSTGT